MSAQYSYNDNYEAAKLDYDVEVMRKRLKEEKANYAYLKFIRMMQKRILSFN